MQEIYFNQYNLLSCFIKCTESLKNSNLCCNTRREFPKRSLIIVISSYDEGYCHP